ncbi:ras-related C3 botulinum toxin substrate 1-like [Penaeus chinensis]|uniref:ras-related C3 botulinum toxin substrate 1-like n=1 Tax=Penaeus chinensis TaxID=139456 RepID=UPI001FB5EF41|nr:ras-related C3 botulinum toxin substrate 1-like [Penaeus chinensis]XP_047493848.1 ras-related C3 botulinum toxin substrate 1-like [Penaeus chinensis]XP_047493857.1 ras-related C3 botulinum toxin substrate 1-like [Penaeus chinensis]XP_047493865.1 ras-related C3 botulinum toxin substrate 1-like [Penaeus chinensis]XP_047493874.1 ras-related C3 botulinum toxin substrate 1-like [Penaeus chinensis]XP_047493883.1 ras-related C3 botulinum toxin substrate 1-like [Penaeus chinensis]
MMSKNLKIVTVGDGGVGKTSLLVAYTQGSFSDVHEPTVFENYSGEMIFNGTHYNFTLWDTAGQEDYDRCRVLCYPETDVFLVCFSVVNKASFSNVHASWLPEIRRECGDKVPAVLVGTKVDLRKNAESTASVTRREGRRLAARLGMKNYVECSAKTGHGCQQAFRIAIEATTPKPICVLL